MKFSEIPAHESVKERLRNLVDTDRMPHALLLEGPAGIGKFAMARALAQYIHCESPENGEPCGHCPSCRQHQSFNHPDVFYSYPILKRGSEKDSISEDWIEQWRNFLNQDQWMDFKSWQSSLGNPNGQPVIYQSESAALLHKFSTTSYSTKYKIMLMWLPERMNGDCANKMLKLIEEPLEDSLMIFTSDRPRDILPTIYSRLQRIEMKRLPTEVVRDYIRAHNDLSDADAASIAHLAEGSILEARRRMADAEEGQRFLEAFIQLMRLAYQRKVGALRKWGDDMAKLGREASMRFFAYCENMMRENFMNNLRIPSLVYLNSSEQAFSNRFSPFINERNVESLVREFTQARIDIRENGNARIIYFDLAIRVILLLKR